LISREQEEEIWSSSFAW